MIPEDGTAVGPVLIVDDDPDIRETLEYILRTEGYLMHGAADGRQALDMLLGISPPCVIVIDLTMPVMSGEELLEALREDARYASIPVIIVTANRPAARLRSYRVFGKPVPLDALLDAIAEHGAARPSLS